MNNLICYITWVKAHQKAELDLNKRSHMAQVIKFHNLIERKQALDKVTKSPDVSDKIG